jgi:hypothetical protein
MFDHRLLDRELASIACQKTGKLTYLVPTPNPTLTWVLSFRLLGVYRWEIDGGLKAVHAEASPFATRCLAQFAGQWWANALQRHPEIGSGIGFPLTNLTDWGPFHSLKIKDLSTQESAARVSKDVKAKVLPFVQSVSNDSIYLDHVLNDELPMRWMYGQPLTRFAEAVLLSMREGRSLSEAKEALERERSFAKGQLQDFELEDYAASVIRAASAASQETST